MRIVQVAAEFAPIAKVGGLGEVLVGLSRELTRSGHSVQVILPKYSFISSLKGLKQEIPEFIVSEGEERISNTLWGAEVEDCHVRLLECRHPKKYFERAKIYGFEDDAARFLYFSRAVVDVLKLEKEPIDILHLHDWHVAAIAPLLREIHRDIPVRKIVLSIHNVEYQGKCLAEDLEPVGLRGKVIERLCTEKHQYNLLKAGIEYADAIVPVSPTYAREILTPPYGFGLEPALQKNKAKIHGILNGIDLKLWDPSQDATLVQKYSPNDAIEAIESAKEANRKAIAKEFNLDPNKRPWIGSITRLASQKGPKLIEEGARQTIQRGGTFALLGSSPDPATQARFESFKSTAEALVRFEHDEKLAHRLFAALDFILIPSLFEPCGLTQMIGMHYGTIPIVRATGGLKDTVFDVEDPSIKKSLANGFSFQQATTEALIKTLERVFRFWKEHPIPVKGLRQRGMQIDFGWEKPAMEYLKIYKNLAGQARNLSQ